MLSLTWFQCGAIDGVCVRVHIVLSLTWFQCGAIDGVCV